MNTRKFSTRQIAFTAVMTALVAVATMVLKIQTGESYTNLGDTMIFLSAAFFGPVPGLIAGALGSFLADLITYPVTMWFTLVIKGIEGLIAGVGIYLANKYFEKTSKDKKAQIIKYVLYLVSCIIAAAWMVGGYYVAKAFMYGTKESALISLPKNCVQGGLSIVIASVLYFALLPAVKNLIAPQKKLEQLSNQEKEEGIE